MKFIPDILEDLIENRLDFVSEIWSVSYSSPNSTIAVGDVKYLRPKLVVDIGGTDAKVLSVDYDANTFAVAGDFSTESTVTFPKPYFFHGTPLETNSHISKLKDSRSLPMIYLYEVIRERLGGPQSRTSEASLRLFFLDVANFSDWNTNQHYSNTVRAMRNLADYFLWEVRKQNGKIHAGDQSEMIAHVKFGAVNDKGHFQSIFNKHLSGIELSLDLIFKDCKPFKGLNPAQPTTPKSELDTAEGLEAGLEYILIG